MTRRSAAAVVAEVVGPKGRHGLDIIWVNVGEVRPYPHNPASRVENIDDIKKSIESTGFDPSRPIVVGKDLVIGDGNRRYRAALMLELEEVPIVINFDATADQIYASHNSTQKPISARQGLEWYMSKALSGERVSPNDIPGLKHTVKSNIARLEEIGGKRLLLRCLESGLSPVQYRAVHRAARLAYGEVGVDVLRRLLYALYSGKLELTRTRALSELNHGATLKRLLDRALAATKNLSLGAPVKD